MKKLDYASNATVVATLGLFVVSLFVTGLTHDLLLEIGVFLVSAKLIIMAEKDAAAMAKLTAQLDSLRAELRQLRPARE